MKFLVIFLFLFTLPIYGREIYVGVYNDFPISKFDEETPYSFGLEYIIKAAKKNNWDYRIVHCSVSDCLSQLEWGKIDILPHVLSTRVTKLKYKFSKNVIYQNHSYALVSNNSALSRPSDLNYTQVGIQKNDSYFSITNAPIRSLNLIVDFKFYNSYLGLLKELNNGKLDSAIVNEVVVKFAEKNFSKIRAIKLDNESTPVKVGFNVNVPNKYIEQVDEVIESDIIISDKAFLYGHDDFLHRDYLGRTIKKNLVFLLVLTIFVFLIIFFIFLLRKKGRNYITLYKATKSMEKTKNEFILQIGNQVKAPLNSILGISENLKRNNVEKHFGDSINVISKTGKQVLKFVDDIVDFSKIEIGQMSVKNSEFDLSIFLKNQLDLSSSLYENENIIMSGRISSSVPITIYSDHFLLGHAISNLLHCSNKLTTFGEINVAVDRYTHDSVLFSVSHSGDSFLELLSNQDFSLSVVTRIIELIGGSYEICDDEKYGQRFSFSCPNSVLSFSFIGQVENYLYNKAVVLGCRPHEKRVIEEFLNDNGNHLIVDYKDVDIKEVKLAVISNNILSNTDINESEIFRQFKKHKIPLFFLGEISDSSAKLLKGFQVNGHMKRPLISRIISKEVLFGTIKQEERAPSNVSIGTDRKILLIDESESSIHLSRLLLKDYKNIAVENEIQRAVESFLYNPYEVIIINSIVTDDQYISFYNKIRKYEQLLNRGATEIIFVGIHYSEGFSVQTQYDERCHFLPSSSDRKQILQILSNFDA